MQVKRQGWPIRGQARVALAALLLTGCHALPRIVPDMAMPHKAVRLETAGGRTLSQGQSQRILDPLQNGHAADAYDRHFAVEEALAGTPLTTGNGVTLLQNGPATYTAMLAAIRQARDHINMETYVLEADEVGRTFAALLIEKQNQGVQVNLIYDSVGAYGTPAAYFKGLTDAGARVLEFNPVNPLIAKAGWAVNQRDHRKILIIDGETAFMGGINISAVYSGGSAHGSGRALHPPATPKLPWRDTDLQVRGPVVAELQRCFLDTWQRQKGAPLAARDYFPKPTPQGRSVVRAIASTPDEPFSRIYATLLSEIASAETSVWLTNAYFVPDPQMLAALLAAVTRGVDVRLVLPGHTDSALVFHAGRASYDRLLRGGVKIFERQEALLHAKTVVIDGVWSTVGSTNLDWRSFLHNQEVNLVILGPEFGKVMTDCFLADQDRSTAITLERWRHRPFLTRLKEQLAKCLEYWL